jgi:hypothetical protein
LHSPICICKARVYRWIAQNSEVDMPHSGAGGCACTSQPRQPIRARLRSAAGRKKT